MRPGPLVVRYAPAAAAAIALVLVVTLTPTTSPRATDAGLGPQDGSTGPLGGSAGGTARGHSTTPRAGSSTEPRAGSADGTAGSTDNSRPGTGPTVTRPVTTHGVSRAGVACRPGARQVSWTVYAPPCVAAYRGSNGGAS
ncbi:MAG: hypothetical protein ABR549_16040, partial [Mycobacteriales bacterium]